MRKETLLRALTAVRTKIATADSMAVGWLAERDRRRRQEAAFLRRIVRLEGSQRKAALATGISPRSVRRILDPQGHAAHRADGTRRRSGATFQKMASPPAEVDEEPMPTNVVKLHVKLRDLYERDRATLVSLGFRKTVSAAESALRRCSRLEQAYFICEIIPHFQKDLEAWLRRRKQDEIIKFRYTEETAEDNQTAHGTV
jgi:hypothetical protein